MTSTTETQKSPITLTETAVIQLKDIMREEKLPEGIALRVGVEGGGCSGFTYILRFEEEQESDQIFDVEGIKVAIDKSHALYLIGMEVNWLNGLNNRGFEFNNPNAKDTCGCGTSFSA